MLNNLRNKLEGLIRKQPTLYWIVHKFVTKFNLFLPHELDFYGLIILYNLFPNKKFKSFIDIGANDGGSILSIRHLKYFGKIEAFEPSSASLSKLLKIAEKDKNLIIYNYGIVSTLKSETLFIPQVQGKLLRSYSSISKVDSLNRITNDLYIEPSLVIFREEKIVLKELDDFHIDPWCIKVDTEGYEAEILMKNLKIIKIKRPILYMEFNFDSSFDSLTQALGSIDFGLYQFDLKLKKFIKLNKEKIISRNCFFIPNELIFSDNSY
jgi:FkbM family methyltransferase